LPHDLSYRACTGIDFPFTLVEAFIFALALSVLSSLRPTRRRQRCSRPRDKLIGFVEQPLRCAPKGEVYGAALLFVAEGRKGLGWMFTVVNHGRMTWGGERASCLR
jgi:hypothetical protein